MGKIEKGSLLVFGGYQWRILDIKDNRALIITEDIISQQSYHNCSGHVTWAECALRKYLNEVFYEQFDALEKAKIIGVKNTNDDNQWYGSEGGEDTDDYIFLLSIEEAVCKYFGDSSKHLENPTAKQRYWFQTKDPNNKKRVASLEGNGWWWWLRSPGRHNKRAVYIHGDGNLGIQGNGTYGYNSKNIHPSTGDNCGGLRPVLWLDISSII